MENHQAGNINDTPENVPLPSSHSTIRSAAPSNASPLDAPPQPDFNDDESDRDAGMTSANVSETIDQHPLDQPASNPLRDVEIQPHDTKVTNRLLNYHKDDLKRIVEEVVNAPHFANRNDNFQYARITDVTEIEERIGHLADDVDFLRGDTKEMTAPLRVDEQFNNFIGSYMDRIVGISDFLSQLKDPINETVRAITTAPKFLTRVTDELINHDSLRTPLTNLRHSHRVR